MSAQEDPDSFIARWVGASNAGDWQTFADMLHEDVVLADPMASEPAQGRAEVLSRAQAQFAPFADGRVEVLTEPMTRPGTPVLSYHWRFTGTHTDPIEPPGFAPTGARVTVEGVSLITVGPDGRATTVRMFYDTTGVAQQVGAAPSAGSVMERGVVLAQRLRVRLRRAR